MGKKFFLHTPSEKREKTVPENFGRRHPNFCSPRMFEKNLPVEKFKENPLNVNPLGVLQILGPFPKVCETKKRFTPN